MFGDLDADRKTTKSSAECPNEFSNDNMIIKAEKEILKKSDPLQLSGFMFHFV